MPDIIDINEPVATDREASVRLTLGNAGVPNILNANILIKIAKPGGNLVTDAACSVTEVTGGVDPGTYRLRFSPAAVDTAGDVEYEISDATSSNVFTTQHGAITVRPLRDALYYGPISAGSVNSVTLSGAGTGAPSAIDSFYAGGGRNCVALITSGTGKGQANLANSYVGATKALGFAINWPVAPDNTSIIRLLPIHAQLDAATVAAIQAGLATAANLATANTNIAAIQTGMARLNGLLQENSLIDNVVWGSNNVITQARVRVFADSAGLAAAVAGHANGADGELYRYTITAVDVGGGQFSEYRKSRSL